MKKQHISLTVILMGVLLISLSAQQKKEADEIKETLTVLFDLSKKDDYKTAASYIVYSGNDEKRKFVDTYNYNERVEAKDVKRIAKKIKALLDITDNYKFLELTNDSQDGKTIFVQLVNFESSGQKLTTKFEFLKVGDKYLLLNVK